jgi:hypothetical protein
MSWLQKVGFYYKGKLECSIIDDLGGGRVLVQFTDGRRASVFRNQIKTEKTIPSFIFLREIECPECKSVNNPGAIHCQYCNTDLT